MQNGGDFWGEVVMFQWNHLLIYFKRCFFVFVFFDVEHFKSLYRICYSSASVLYFGCEESGS